MNSAARRGNRKAGFTLIETMIALLVLTIVMVGVFRTINGAQTYYGVEGQKVDFTQQEREFIDQFTRDLHQAGFPSANSLGPINAAAAAQGLTAFTPTSLTMSGDLDGIAGVQTVTYDYNAACACLRRTVAGAAFTSGVDGVIPPPGNAGIFTGYDINGLPTLVAASVRSVQITFSVQGASPNNSPPIQITMTGMARLPNVD
jgi:prepilin-type N-terminal cleavage/methylation domain-containing protein